MKRILISLFLMSGLVLGCVTDSGDDNTEGDDNGGGNTNNPPATQTYSITGQIENAEGEGIKGVTVRVNDGDTIDKSVTTDANGLYTVAGLTAGSYTLTPSLSGYTFTPESQQAVVSDASIAVPLFSATASGNSGGNGGSGGNGSGDGEAGSLDFYPVKVNATWTYTSQENWEYFTDEYSYTETVTGTVMIDGKNYWELETSYEDDDMTDRSWIRMDNNVFYSFIDDIMEGVGKRLPSKMVLIQADSSQEVPFFKFGLSSGASWNIFTSTYTSSEGQTSIDMKGKYTGTGSVSIPLGSYSGCPMFEITTVITSVYDGITYENTMVDTYWFARNIGIVKSLSVSSFSSSESSDGDDSYTTEDYLTSYNIP